jgi:hypothetical protein
MSIIKALSLVSIKSLNKNVFHFMRDYSPLINTIGGKIEASARVAVELSPQIGTTGSPCVLTFLDFSGSALEAKINREITFNTSYLDKCMMIMIHFLLRDAHDDF